MFCNGFNLFMQVFLLVGYWIEWFVLLVLKQIMFDLIFLDSLQKLLNKIGVILIL